VITDAPLGPAAGPRISSVEVAASPVGFFASPGLAAELDGPFPACLEGAPMILPTPEIAMRRELDRWLDARDLRPRVVAELDDGGMTKTLGSRGHGIFIAPMLVGGHVERRFEVTRIGEAPDLVERFHAVTAERRVEHPMVNLITAMRWSAATSEGDAVAIPAGADGRAARGMRSATGREARGDARPNPRRARRGTRSAPG